MTCRELLEKYIELNISESVEVEFVDDMFANVNYPDGIMHIMALGDKIVVSLPDGYNQVLQYKPTKHVPEHFFIIDINKGGK